MKRLLYLLAFIILVPACGELRAQTPSPSPTPADKQNVRPENLNGVPSIAPNYRSADRDLPDLGRIGVDMASQRP